MNKKQIHSVQSAIINQCLLEDISHPEDITLVVVEALKTINASSVAGHRAAVTKGQTLACERY